MWKVLIVGLGQIGMGYDYDLNPEEYVLTHAQAFQKHPLFELTGGVDINSNHRELFVKKYAKPVFCDINDALKITQPDIVVISSPTVLHGEIIRTILQESSPAPIAILCEKPLSYDLAEAHQIMDMCKAQGCRLFVNYMRRSDPGVAEIKRRLDARLIDYPIKGTVWYSKGLIHNGSHFFNLLQYWLGDTQKFQIIDSGGLWDGIDPEPDIQVTFARGTVTFLAVCEKNFSHCTVELIAKNGRLFYARGGEKITWQDALKDPVLKGYTRLTTVEENIESGIGRRSQYHVIEQLALKMTDKEGQICSGSDAIKTLESLAAIRNKL